MVKETDSHATLRFTIQDTGIGISADHINKLFQSFSQADTGVTRKYGGTGLGLAISKQIIELMGGQISVESEEGKGSTFWFTAVLEKQPSDHQQTPFDLGNIENMRILIIDEDSTSRHTLKADLDSWHCRAEEVDSVEEAMKKLQAAATDGEPFKVVLLDPYTLKLDVEALGRKIKEDPQLQGVHFVILTSAGKRGDAKYFQRLGFEAYLAKPLGRSMLCDCLQIITGKHASAWKNTSMQIITRHTIAEDYKKRTSILVVEDNMINQKIALRILDKKLGYYVDAVSNGKEAVELLKMLDYDLVLMDCQMPEMDGYEATHIIRDANSAVLNHNIPIIAMTADVMKGAREKCLEAGMNDYVSKPVNVQKLADAIKRNIHDGKEHPALLSLPVEPESKQATQDVPGVIYSEYKDDPDLAGLIDAFIASLGEDIKTMRRELEHGNYDGLRRLAHQMKGAGGSYGYPEITEAAKKLEDAAKAKDVDAGELALGKLTTLCQAATRGGKSSETL
jgi:CheY-like chemotaxis protein